MALWAFILCVNNLYLIWAKVSESDDASDGQYHADERHGAQSRPGLHVLDLVHSAGQ